MSGTETCRKAFRKLWKRFAVSFRAPVPCLYHTHSALACRHTVTVFHLETPMTKPALVVKFVHRLEHKALTGPCGTSISTYDGFSEFSSFVCHSLHSFLQWLDTGWTIGVRFPSGAAALSSLPRPDHVWGPPKSFIQSVPVALSLG